MKHPCASLLLAIALLPLAASAAEPLTLNLWPGKPPGETKDLPPESDQTKPDDKLIAGRRIIKLGHVSTPQIAIFRPPTAQDTGAAVIVAPGGGHHILAYDLEGTEVAAWLNSIGVTGIVLKYRVPFRNPDKRWEAAVQDAQRALSLVRGRSQEWGLDSKRLGILGFSAGGQTAALAALLSKERQYAPVDDVDQVSCRPDFAVLIYPGGLLNKDNTRLLDEIKVTAETPPMFFAHAHDDRVSPLNSALLYAELKRAAVPAELHIYSAGGHGYGLRPVPELPVTSWPKRCEEWLQTSGWLKR
jgi:acetyl esterase/lipase